MSRHLSLGGLGVADLAARVWARLNSHHLWDTAAGLGYYFMLALFPLVVFLISLLTVLDATGLVGRVMQPLGEVMPPDAYELLAGQVQLFLSRPRGGLLTFGAIGTLWAASSGVVSLMGGLNRARDVEDERGFLRLRIVALTLTVALALLVILGALLLATGDRIAFWVATLVGMRWIAVAGVAVNYAVGIALMLLGLALIYYFGPDARNRHWRWISPGAAFAVALFLAFSIGFSLYVRYFSSYDAMYGSLGAVIVLMLWLYILGLAVTTGAAIDAEVEKAGRPRAPEQMPRRVDAAA